MSYVGHSTMTNHKNVNRVFIKDQLSVGSFTTIVAERATMMRRIKEDRAKNRT